jgi:hypothetical protein
LLGHPRTARFDLRQKSHPSDVAIRAAAAHGAPAGAAAEKRYHRAKFMTGLRQRRPRPAPRAPRRDLWVTTGPV